MPMHHPDEALLVDYASGALPEAIALVVATHLALCPQCRADTDSLDAVGGEILDSAESEPVSEMSRDLALVAIDRAAPPKSPVQKPDLKSGDVPVLPRPLRDYAGGDPSTLTWRRLGNLAEAPIYVGGDVKARLMQIRAGSAMPRHGHHGMEYTLVLDGGFSDELGHYLRGDLAVADPALEHKPIADPDGDCLCLAVSEGSIRFTGIAGRILSLFLPR
jgi:putative transcriptional regulator